MALSGDLIVALIKEGICFSLKLRFDDELSHIKQLVVEEAMDNLIPRTGKLLIKELA